MPASRKKTLSAVLKVYGPAVLLTLGAFLLAYQFVDPAPPKQLRLAAGAEGGAYAAFAGRYRELLAREGIELEVLHSRGSVDNLALLRAGKTDLAFVQGGLGTPAAPGLYSLGSLYFEPGWLFYRGKAGAERLSDLEGARVAIGESGSGTRALALVLIADNAMDEGRLQFADLGGEAAADAVEAGDVDAAFFVAGADSALVQRLIRNTDVNLMSFRRAAAYTRLHPYLSQVVLPEGMIDMPANIPPGDVHLVAPAATLVSRDGVHPALLDLMLQAAKKIHGTGGWFETEGRFPSREFLQFPLSAEAERFYQHGPPLLQRYLPFWAATLVDRLKVMLLPLIVILLPLLRIMPPLYDWRMRARIYRWYKELEELEERIRNGVGESERKVLAAQLERIDTEVQKLHVPLSFAAQSYDLRMHIGLVRESLSPRQPR